MARTRQTARRSTGGLRLSYSSDDNGNTAVSRQVDIFNRQGSRTIVVEGTSEFDEMPDIVHLSFLIEQVSNTVEEGISEVINKIRQVRSIVSECGVPNENISSDSIGSKMIKKERGVERDNTFEVHETVITYQVKSVVRIVLEGENVQSLFGKVCYEIMTKAGLRTHEAPKYDCSDLTALRNTARRDACKNAKEKATAILDALDDPTVKLGRPITITDLHCNIEDDAEDSFVGNFTHVEPWRTEREAIGTARNSPPPPKKVKLDETENDAPSINEEAAQQIFVVPSTRIKAWIKVIFEIRDVVETVDTDDSK